MRILQCLSDYVNISVNRCTLIRAVEYRMHNLGQDAYKSLNPQEINIPRVLFILGYIYYLSNLAICHISILDLCIHAFTKYRAEH